MLNPNHIGGPGEAILAVTMLLACLIAGAYPVLKLIGWWLDGSLEPLVAGLGLFLYMVMLVMVTMLPPAFAIPIVLVIIVSAGMIPYFSQVSDQRQLTKMADAKIEQCIQALERNERDAPARMELARILHKKGDLDLAISHMEWTLQQFPSLGLRIRPDLESWKRERARLGEPPPVFCHRCKAENPPGSVQCRSCGAAFGVRAGMKQGIEKDGGPVKIIRTWILMASLVLLGTFLFLSLPAIIAAPILAASVLVGSVIFLRWVGGDLGTVGD